VLHRYATLTARRDAEGVRDHSWLRYDGLLWQEGFFYHGICRHDEVNIVRHAIGENPLRREL
jgi:hypothetical protein